MELRHLKYFVMVAEELHFSRAAEKLHLAQQPLSAQIKRLEEELGVQLFDRTTRKVTLTEAGEAFLQEVRLGLAHLDTAVEAAQRVARGEAGQLVLGYVGSTLYNIMPVTVRTIRERFPHVHLVLRELCSPELEQKICEQEIDIGLLVPDGPDHVLACEIVHREETVVALPQGHPLAARTHIPLRLLADEPIVIYDRLQKPLPYDMVIALCREAGFSPHIVQEAASEQTVLGLVAAGMGIALVPAGLHLLYNESVHYRPLIEPSRSIDFALAWRQDNTSPLVKAVCHTVRTCLSSAPI